MAGIALEDLDSKLDMIVEVVKDSERRLSGQVNEMKTELKQDIADIHLLLRRHTDSLQGHEQKIQKHDEEIVVLKQTSRH